MTAGYRKLWDAKRDTWIEYSKLVKHPEYNSWQAALDDWYDEKKEAEEKGNTADR